MELLEKENYAKSMGKNVNIFGMFHTILYKAQSPEHLLLKLAGIPKSVSQVHIKNEVFINRGKPGILI